MTMIVQAMAAHVKQMIAIATVVMVAGMTTGRTAQPNPQAELQGAPKAGITVLDKRTLLRRFFVDRTPVVLGNDGGFKQAFIPMGKTRSGQMRMVKIIDYQSPMPDKSWREADFDDSEWSRVRGSVERHRGQRSAKNPSALHDATRNSIICLRGKFLVDDPEKAGSLHLSLKYVGGVAVFVNGKELTRQHLPKGELKPETLAEKYPDDLYITANGNFLLHCTVEKNATKRMRADERKRLQKRFRYLKDLTIPSSMLRKGLNVLAMQLHRAPVNEAATKVERRWYDGMYRVPGLWAYVALGKMTLKASPGGIVTPNIGRPKGIQVWNCKPYATLSAYTFSDPGNRPAPIEIDALRNGTFSGRFGISSDTGIKNLKVVLSELVLAGGKAKLPDGAVSLRYGRPAVPMESSRARHLFDGLVEAIPSSVDVYGSRTGGAVVSLWLTVRVPKDTVPGLYQGKVTVQAEGLNRTTIPVQCRVYGWNLPEPVNYRVKNLNVFSPYSLALHYKVPLWSEAHYKLIEKSFKLMADINARRVDIDMVPVLRAEMSPIAHSMFRLIPKKGGGGYDYDFSVVDRIFDLVEKTMQAPLPLQVNCWGDDRMTDKHRKIIRGWRMNNKYVPLLDPATGKISHIENPPPGSEKNYQLWKPILDALRKRIEKRGWFAVTAFGHQSYCWFPSRGQVDVAKRIWPDGVWSFTAHSGTLNGCFKGSKRLRVPVRYSECVWTRGKYKPRGYTRLLKPGRGKSVWNSVERNGHKDSSSLSTLFRKPEEMIMRGHDGLGYMCSDFLPIQHPKRKGKTYLLNSGVGGVLGYSTRSFLAAGADGPIATGRYEMFREGIQQCEAILYLQRALDAKQLSEQLAGRVNAYLDKRSEAFLKPRPVNRRQSDRMLFALAAEVAAQ
jgi:Glycoside hydrolase 123, catalytic domain